MQVRFAKEALRELYDNGKTSEKSYRFQPQIVQKYQYCIDVLKDMPNVEALYKYNALHYEVLKGEKKGISSIRVNNRYRIEFTVHEAEFKGKVVDTLANICNIIDLSNHYK
jgi:proteic killer suppression protein